MSAAALDPPPAPQAGALGRALATGRVTLRSNAWVVSHCQLVIAAAAVPWAVVFVGNGQRRGGAPRRPWLWLLRLTLEIGSGFLLHSGADHQSGGVEDPPGFACGLLLDGSQSPAASFSRIPDQPAPRQAAELSACWHAFFIPKQP